MRHAHCVVLWCLPFLFAILADEPDDDAQCDGEKNTKRQSDVEPDLAICG
jgi:hypothetical protein